MVDRVETDVSPFKPGGRFVEEDGTLTGDGYRFLDQLWKRSGGFLDGGWDTAAVAESLQTQIGELNTKIEGLLADRQFADESRAIDLLQRIEALEAGLEDTNELSQDALRQALNIDDPNILTGGVKTRGIAANAVSKFVFNSASSSAITTTNPKRTNSNTVTLDVDLTSGYVPGGEIAILVDFEHEIDSQAFNWVVMSLELERYALGPTGSPTSIRRSLWVQAGDAGNTYLPDSINNETLTFPHNWVYTETLPDVGDADYNEDGYTYRAKIEVADDWDDGSTMIDGYDTPGTGAQHHRIVDWEILLLHLKR